MENSTTSCHGLSTCASFSSLTVHFSSGGCWLSDIGSDVHRVLFRSRGISSTPVCVKRRRCSVNLKVITEATIQWRWCCSQVGRVWGISNGSLRSGRVAIGGSAFSWQRCQLYISMVRQWLAIKHTFRSWRFGVTGRLWEGRRTQTHSIHKCMLYTLPWNKIAGWCRWQQSCDQGE